MLWQWQQLHTEGIAAARKKWIFYWYRSFNSRARYGDNRYHSSAEIIPILDMRQVLRKNNANFKLNLKSVMLIAFFHTMIYSIMIDHSIENFSIVLEMQSLHATRIAPEALVVETVGFYDWGSLIYGSKGAIYWNRWYWVIKATSVRRSILSHLKFLGRVWLSMPDILSFIR